MIIEANKNAGICIASKSAYKDEVLRQLNDIDTYHPCTETQFRLSMIEFRDKLKRFAIFECKNKLSQLLPIEDKPAFFFILPKIHKPFQLFPKGRPISSTCNKTNKFASKLLDFALKPCITQIKDLLIDTQHFLLLINEVKLRKDRKFAFVTIDIESLYINLRVSDCRKHCVKAYLDCNSQAGVKFNEQQINDLITLNLGYNYVQYEENWVFQHRGIEMGNAASVMVANITVYNEICHIFDIHSEIIFNKRFLDDIFLIVDITDMESVSDWLDSILKHRYLNFTSEFSEKGINFLDVNVILSSDNTIQTELYSKPMSRHLYLHSSSSHPIHLKNSLSFSQGLRIIKICSVCSTRVRLLRSLFVKFQNRLYSQTTLYNTFVRLLYTKRYDVLKPKNPLLLNYLQENEPHIIQKYGPSIICTRQFPKENTAVIVFPFVQRIYRYKQKVQSTIKENIMRNIKHKWKVYVHDLHVQVVFSRTRNMKEMLQT